MTERPRNDLDYSGRGMVADVAVSFAGVLLVVSGALDVLQGASAIANDELFSANTDYLYRFNMNVWGVVHLVIGVVSVVVAVAVLRRIRWGQIAGIVVAGLAAISNFMFAPVYPWWAVTLVAFNLFVMWALSVQLRHYR